MQPSIVMQVAVLALTVSSGAPGWPAAGGSGAAASAPVVGISAEPGGLLIQGVVPGEVCDLGGTAGVRLTVHNRDAIAHTYALSSHRPSEVGSRRLPAGYSDIPDPAWFWFEQDEVRVEGRGSADVAMYIGIPDDERYLNQHWSVSIGVAGKPEPGQALALAVYPRYEIETAPAPREDLRLRPAGAIGICPSVVAVEGGRRPDTLAGEFYVCNNDRRRHSYRLTALRGGEIPGGGRPFPSGGRSWLPEEASLSLRRPKRRPTSGFSARHWPTVWLGPHRHVAVPIEVRLAEGERAPDGRWESAILVERDDGERAFVRVWLPEGQTEAAEGG